MSTETIALLAFRNTDGSLGFAQSRDPLTYGIRLERGINETRRVRERASLEWMALFPSRDLAVEARDRLNEMEAEEAESEMRRLALPSEVVEGARSLIWAHVWEDGGEEADEEDRGKLLAAIAAALAGGLEPPSEDGGGKVDGDLRCEWPQRLLIFDLDGTLADTSAFDGSHRRSHGGRLDEIKLFGATNALGPHDLARIAAEGRRVVVVTSSPRSYAQDVLSHIGLKVAGDDLYSSVSSDKRDAFGRAMEAEGCEPAETIVVGDRWPDWKAAASLGIPSLGGRDFGAKLPDQAADVSFRTIEAILAISDPSALRYIGEEDQPEDCTWHEGSMLKVGPNCWALGRYFNKDTRAELGIRSRLSEDIVAGKRGAPPARLEAAVRMVLGRMARSDRMDIRLVASMPPKPGQQDRFAQPARWARQLFGVANRSGAGTLRDLFPGRGSQGEKGSRQERFDAQKDRYAWAGEELNGRAVLLLDDVRTTGASVDSAAVALRRAGAREVFTLVWGQTQAWYERRDSR